MKVVLLLAALNSLTGTWIGQVLLGERPMPVRFEFSSQDNKATGTISIPFEGILNRSLSKIELFGSEVQFALEGEPFKISFTGSLKDQRIDGEAKTGDGTKGTFEITRIMPVRNEDYFGAYKMEDGGLLFIRTWDELGDKQLTFLNEDGSVGPLFARTEREFFTGPGLFIPLPEQGHIQFDMNTSSGPFPGLTWSDPQGKKRKGVRADGMFEERNVRFSNGDVSLGGSLVIPKGAGPFPAIVLVHGSGPVTRDFFGPVSYLFASNGIAVLSYDKRGVGESSGDWMEASFQDYAADALAGVQYLQNIKAVDPKRIGLWGASQAGWIIPEAVAKDDRIAFAVLLSVPGVTPFDQELQRTREEMRANDASPAEIEKAISQLKGQIESLRTDDVKKHLQEQVRKLKNEGNHEALKMSGADNPKFLLWYASLLDHSPVEALSKMKCPVLVLYGELDRGVPVELNRHILESAFKKGGNDRVTLHIFPKGNHALMASETGSMREFPYLTHFVPGLFDRTVEWIHKQATSRACHE